jgi:putative glutamine amidotransferase
MTFRGYGHPPGARRPLIGITPDVSGPNTDVPILKYELKAPYGDAVLKAGGLPLILTYSEDPSAVDPYLDRIAGLVVTGGAFDIPPEAYGETPRVGLGVLKPARTTFETALLRGALERNIPVLGICGGMQLLNVVMGGTLYQDLGRDLSTASDHEQKHDRTQPAHPIEVKAGTLLAEMVGKGQLMVNSTHHQAAKDIGTDVVVSAVASDGVVEAIELKGNNFAVGVQWHPELLVGTVPIHLSLYRGLVYRARELRR